MDRLSHKDYDKVLDFIAAIQAPSRLADFGSKIVRLCAELIPGATIAFDQIDERSGEYCGFDHNVELAVGEQVALHARLQQLYQQNPIFDYIKGGGNEPVVDLDDLMPKSQFRRTEFYQDIFRPHHINHQASVLLSRDGWINTLTVNHERPLKGAVKAMLTLAARHVILAHQQSCREEVWIACTSLRQPVPACLTAREAEVFIWLREGKRNSEIACILGCAARTIDKHVEHILAKTHSETRTAASRIT